MNCDCIKMADEKLKSIGVALDLAFRVPDMFPLIQIQTKRIDNKRKKATPVMVTFCPFCGVRANGESHKSL